MRVVLNERKRRRIKMRDIGMIGAFVGALAVLVFVGFYVTARFVRERVSREKWKDYDDCGWA
jgi:hypothetical protein